MLGAERYLERLWQLFKTSYAGLRAVPTVSADTNTSAANTDAVITYAALAGLRHCLSGVIWSYDDDPAGRLTIAEGVTMLVDVDITNGGPGFLPFERGKSGGCGLPLTITLHAGGVGIVGKLNVTNHWTESC